MTPEEVVATLEKCGALFSGHFKLSAGLHGDRYIQGAQALQYPAVAEKFGAGIAGLLAGEKVDLVAAPALGGIIIGHEVARALRVPFIFSERQEGKMLLRRGFAAGAGKRALLIEDVVTTGKSVLECAEVVRATGAKIAGYGCIVDRSGGKHKLPEAPRALAKLDFRTYDPAACPLCQAGSEPVKPGSRPG